MLFKVHWGGLSDRTVKSNPCGVTAGDHLTCFCASFQWHQSDSFFLHRQLSKQLTVGNASLSRLLRHIAEERSQRITRRKPLSYNLRSQITLAVNLCRNTRWFEERHTCSRSESSANLTRTSSLQREPSNQRQHRAANQCLLSEVLVSQNASAVP